MRYDHTVPVQPRLLTQLLKNIKNNIFCRLIPDVLHAKIIWWQGYGAYIGSANLSNRAWWTNIETGMFFTEEDLVSNNMVVQLEKYFDELKELEESVPLSQDIIDEQLTLLKDRKKAGLEQFDDKTRKGRKIPEFNGVSDYTKSNTVDKRKENFRKEWQSAISKIDNIASQINDFRPDWVLEDIPAYWQSTSFYMHTTITKYNKRMVLILTKSFIQGMKKIQMQR